MWKVTMVPEAMEEFRSLPDRERAAMQEAFQKLKVEGDQLGAPHSSKVQGTKSTVRELRPRRGSSPFRAFYRRIAGQIVIGAIGPEAVRDRRGFNRAVAMAESRLADFTNGNEETR